MFPRIAGDEGVKRCSNCVEIERLRADYHRLLGRLTAVEGSLSHRLALRREIEAALGITSEIADDEALARGLAAIQRLQRERDEALALLRDLRRWIAEDLWEAPPQLKARLDALLGKGGGA